MKLSANFTLAEATRSDAARAMGDANMPTAEHLANLRASALCMEHVRALLGGFAITPTSVYRNPVVNAAVGGTDTSDHAHGWAWDFRHSSLDPLIAARRIRDSCLVFDQLILESGRKIVHLSFAPRLRRQVGHQPGGPGSPITWRLP